MSHSNAIREGGYRSKFEFKIAQELKLQGVPFEYETIKIPYTISKTYSPDFILGNGIMIEAKGMFKREDRKKHLLIKEQNPEFDIRFVLQGPNTRVPGARYSCADWCERHGFKYAKSTIPRGWIDEVYLERR